MEIRIVAGCWSGGLEQFIARLTESFEHDVYRLVVPNLVDVLKKRIAANGSSQS